MPKPSMTKSPSNKGRRVTAAKSRTGPAIIRPGPQEECGDASSQMVEALEALDGLSRSAKHSGGWVDTGAVAEATGVSVGEAAARLRTANRQGLCAIRRSLRDGTAWRPQVRTELSSVRRIGDLSAEPSSAPERGYGGDDA
jgi:hypothetical protein